MMSTSNENNDGVSKSNDDVCDVIDKLNNMNTEDKDDVVVPVCANCGKEGDDINNICNKCKQVKYCNAACKKRHRHKHKKECDEHVRLATENAAKLHDKKLFQQPPRIHGDCPICFQLLPTLETGWRYNSCCGKEICSGCCHAPVYDNQGNVVSKRVCPFCRTPPHTSDEGMIERYKKRVEANDPVAICNQGCHYYNGTRGYPQDMDKALEYWHRATELGDKRAYRAIGYAYNNGRGVEFDKKKAKHYYELAAMGGDSAARGYLGNIEAQEGNMDRALKHYMIAVGSGDNHSLEMIQRMYSDGYATKDDYLKALQSYQTYLGEIKSKQRDEAAAARADNRYY